MDDLDFKGSTPLWVCMQILVARVNYLSAEVESLRNGKPVQG